MKTILTGDRPTGPLHLGHFIGSLQNRVKLQNEYKQYVMIADLQALTDNVDNVAKIRDNILEVMLDYLAVGIDPNKTTIFLQSLIPELAELTFYYLNLVTVARLGRNPTVKHEMELRDFKQDVPAGFYCYPVSQAADITAFKANLVPAGLDQKPMIEQTNEIVRKFNATYHCNVLVETEFLESHAPRLSGIDGKAKMSKSLNNAIYLSDAPDVIKTKVQKMYTDPTHLKVSDPGKIEGNVVFEFLTAFDVNQKEVAELKLQYQQGGLGDSILKKRLTELLITLLEPIQQRRQQYATDKQVVAKLLLDSTEKARLVAVNTVKEVKAAMGIGNFL
jgi:tryptophanyl-tRNA synthetase